MAFGIPDFLRYDLRHRIERFQDGVKRGNLRAWINDRLGLVLAVTAASGLLLAVMQFAPCCTGPQAGGPRKDSRSSGLLANRF